MKRLTWPGLIRGLFRGRPRRQAGRRRQQHHAAPQPLESLEPRQLLAIDFVSAAVTEGETFFTAQIDQGLIPLAGTLSESPQQITLRFTPGSEIDPDPEALLEGVSIVRSGGRGDGFGGEGSLADISVSPGVLVVDDLPARNQVVIRFAEPLPDDTYRFTISSTIDQATGAISGLRTVDEQAFRGGGSFSFDVNISLGPQVVAVVPQPVSRAGEGLTNGLTQSRNTINVYFNAAEALNTTAAETVDFYKLIQVDKGTGEDVTDTMRSPVEVVYDATTHSASLRFAPTDIVDGELYRLEIGGSGILAAPQVIPGIVGDAGSSYDTALATGTIDESGVVISASIDAESSIPQPGTLPDLRYPNQPGSLDEPGHRDVPIDNSNHGVAELGYEPVSPDSTEIFTVPFNFKTNYGSNTQGNPLSNLMTAEQKLRVREVFDLFSRYAGIRFVETPADGITVALGDTRVISDNTPVGSLEGLSRGSITAGVPSDDALAVINANRDWGESEYGGAFFTAAMRQIGKVLGLWHSYDVPSVLGESLPGEAIFPSDNDLLHLQQLYPRGGTDIDLYAFSLTEAGTVSAETFAARFSDGASTLDTVLSVFSSTSEATARVTGPATTVTGQTATLAGGTATVAGQSVTVTAAGGLVAGVEAAVAGQTLVVAGAETTVAGISEVVDGVAARVSGIQANVQALAVTAVGKLASVTAVATEVLQAVTSSTTVFLDDVSVITTGAQFLGRTGVPPNTTVEAIDTLAKSIVLSNPVTLTAGSLVGFSLSDVATVTATRFFMSDSAVASLNVPVSMASEDSYTKAANTVPEGTRVTAVDAATGTVTYSQPITVKRGDQLGFGSTTAQVRLADVSAIRVGSRLGIADDSAADRDRPVVVGVNEQAGVITLSRPVTVAAGELLAVDYNPADFAQLNAPATARRFFLDPAALDESVRVGLKVSATRGIAAGTTVESIDLETGEVVFSRPVVLRVGSAVGFGYSGAAIGLDDVSAIVVGASVEGVSVPAGTTVTEVNVAEGQVTLSTSVSLAAGQFLGFSNVSEAAVGEEAPTGAMASRIVVSEGGRRINVGAAVSDASGTPLDVTVSRVDGRVVTLSGPIDLEGVGQLLFGAAGNSFRVADVAGIHVGAIVTAAGGVGPGVVVTSVDADAKRVMVSADVTLSHDDDVQFGVVGTQVAVADVSGVVRDAPVAAAPGIADGTYVTAVDPDTNTITLSKRISVVHGSSLSVGSVGTAVVVDDVSGIADGVLVTGLGIPAATRVAVGGIDAATNTITLDTSVTLAAGATLGFGSSGVTLALNTAAYDGQLAGADISLNGSPTGRKVDAVSGSTVTLDGTIDVAAGDVIGFDYAGSLSTDQFLVDDTAGLTVGAELAASAGAVIAAIDAATGLVTLSAAETVTSGDALQFGFAGTRLVFDTVAGMDEGTPLTGAGLPAGVFVTSVDQPNQTVTVSRPVTLTDGDTVSVGFSGMVVKVDDVSGITENVPITGVAGIRPGTLVKAIDSSTNSLMLSQAVQVAAGGTVRFGFTGTSLFGIGATTIAVDDTTGIVVDAAVSGLPGVADGSVTVRSVDVGAGTITLSADVTVADGAELSFGAVNATTITLGDVTDLDNGMAVSGPGVPAGITISSINPATRAVTLSGAVTVADNALLGFGTTSRELIARNDNAFGRDSFLKIDLDAGNYFVAVTSVGNTAFNPAIAQSGGGGRTQGGYDLSLKFQPGADPSRTIVDASGTPLDGDRDGHAGGAFNFWFTAAAADTIYVDKLAFAAAATVATEVKASATVAIGITAGIESGMEVIGAGVPAGTTVTTVAAGSGTLTLSRAVSLSQGTVLHFDFADNHPSNDAGSLENPFRTIAGALAKAAATDAGIVRVVGNGGDELSGLTIAGTTRSLRPNALQSGLDAHHYYIGADESGNPYPDGESVVVPAGTTLMVDAGSVLRLRQANIDVGSSSELVSRAEAAIQVLGVPERPVRLTSVNEAAVAAGPVPEGGDWGGIVLRADADWQPDDEIGHDTLRPFLNAINHAVIEYGGGEVSVDSETRSFSAIQLEDARPSLGFNQILRSASNAISATPNSFLEAGGRAGPQLAGNVLRLNSTNGLFVTIRTEFGVPLDTLDVAARLTSREVTYVLQESLIVEGGAGSYFEDAEGIVQARPSGRLAVDPGVVLKLQNARIELERGAAQLLAEGTATQRVVMTNLGDPRFGGGGSFDTNGNLPNRFGPGYWGGIILNAGSQASIDHAFISGGGGKVPIEGVLDSFNVIEVHQGDLRLANSRLQSNSAGVALTDRTARGSNEAATVFVRGAQPVIVGNDFRDNAGATISINANSLTAANVPDPGRQSGMIGRSVAFDDNSGPLIRDNSISYAAGESIVVGYDEPALPLPPEPPADGTVQRIDWNGQPVDVLTDSWVVRAAADHQGTIEVQAGWSTAELGGRFHRLIAPGASVSDVIGWAAGSSQVAYAEPNFLLQNQRVPNDPRYGELWGMNQPSDFDIDAPEAWDITTGSNDVVIAVIDSGVDYTHQDLAANIWINPGEIAGDGIDNDGNGFIDDVRGWDFGENDNDPMDTDGHGTHVAGTIGAVANNGTGVVGVAWNVRIMPLKFEDADGNLSIDAAIAAITYATEMRLAGVNVVASNNSWGGGAFSQGLLDAINAGGEAGVLFVAAAGNDSNNNDQIPVYPTSYESDAILSVAATDRNNNLAGFSNFGRTSVDIGAPGAGILSTLPGNAYGNFSGTSMAAPHAAGVAALVAAGNPDATMEEIRDAIIDGAVPIASLAGNVASGGLLNAYGSLAAFRGVSRTAGVVVRGEEIVVDSVWDDTDIVHVLQDEIIVNNLHTATSLKLLSQADASLVVKLAGPNAGFTASGELLDIDDRVGGTVQVIGQPGFPVVLTSLSDDSVGASLDAYGFPVTDTNVDGSFSQPSPGDWRSLQFLPLSNDRNVGVARELELPFTTRDIDANSTVRDAEFLGTLAPNYATDGNTWESAQEKSGDENRRLGFDVSGTIAFNDPSDVDVYSFDGYAGSEVWVDIDQTSTALDTMVEVLDASGRVLARSANSQTDTGSVVGDRVAAAPGGSAIVTGEQATVVGAAAAVTGVADAVDGIDVTVTGVAARATGYQAQVIGIGAQAAVAASTGATTITLDDATGVRIGATPTLVGVIAAGSQVTAVNGNTITIDQPLVGNLNLNDWITFDITERQPFATNRVVFDSIPAVGVWVGDELSGNSVQSVVGASGNITILDQVIEIIPAIGTSAVPRIGLVAEYTFNQGSLLDSSGSRNHGASRGAVITADRFGDQGYAFSFDGIDDLVQMNQPGPVGAVPRSVSFWLNTSDASHQEVINWGSGTNGQSFRISMSINGEGATFDVTNGAVTYPTVVGDGQWHHYVYVLPSLGSPTVGDIQIYKDSVLLPGPFVAHSEGSTRGVNTNQLRPITLGGLGANFYEGALDDIRVYSRAVSQAEVNQLFNEELVATGTGGAIVMLGLSASLGSTSTESILLDNATPIQVGSTVNGGSAAVTAVSLADANASEPNDTLAAATLLSVTPVGGGSSQFTATGAVGDGTFGSRDVDMYRLALPVSAAGSTLTIDGSTVGVDPATAIGDIFLRLFDYVGNEVAFNDDGGPGLDSQLSYVVPASYDGSGFSIGVSGYNNGSYAATTAGSGISGSTGEYILRGSLSTAVTVTPSSGTSTAGVVTLDNPISVSDDQLLAFSLAPGVPVTTSYITVSDASQVAVGAQITGPAGIPDGTTVVGRDLVTRTLELSQPITISLNDLAGIGFVDTTITVADASSLTVGMAVTGDGVPAATSIQAVNPVNKTVTLNQSVDVADGQLLQFGFIGLSVTTDQLFVDDTAATVGATVEAANNPGVPVATVTGIDAATGAVSLSQPVTVEDGEVLNFTFAGQAITARRVVVDDVSGIVSSVLVNEVGVSALDIDVPEGTSVTAVEPVIGSGVIELSGAVTVRSGDSLGFGFTGTDVVLGDVTGVALGEAAAGPGVPAGTTVTGVNGNTVTLSRAVTVADAAVLTFTGQEFALLPSAAAPGAVSVLPGSVTGVVYDGATAIQTFVAERDGDLVFTPVGNPPARAIGGSIDYTTGEVSLTFDKAPRRPASLEVDFDYSTVALETLGFEPGTGRFGAYPLAKDAWRGGDYYTTNPRDAGMRLTLPGTQGTKQKYFIRVRSQPAAGADQATYEANLSQAGPLAAGQTSGNYDLSLRLRQQDEAPGSTVRFADIRYPVTGIDVLGLPNNSPLVGTAGEHPDDNNDTFATAQPLGNLLTSDRNTISVAGEINHEGDIDWYTFTLSYEDIQSLFGHNDGAKTWSTVFDIDYADGFRGDLTLSVFDDQGRLIYIGRDSDVADDQPGPGQEGGDVDDLSRGSVGKLDPFIGPAHLPAGSDGTAGPRTYYVAVSSNERLPRVLDQTFTATATNSSVRLEPVTSIQRVVEDHIGRTGYRSYVTPEIPSGRDSGQVESAGIFNLQNLDAHVRPFTLADVRLFVSSGGAVFTADAYSGGTESVLNTYGTGIGDIDMRTDGRLFQYVGIPGDTTNVGALREISPGDGGILSSGGDGIVNLPENPGAGDAWKVTSDSVDAVAIRKTGGAAYVNSTYYSVRDGQESRLYHAQSSGNAATGDGWSGFQGVIAGDGVTGFTTGLQFLDDVGFLYGVSDQGQFYRVNPNTGEATNVTNFASYLEGTGFQGLASGPQNLEGGRYSGTFFAITRAGRLVCIDPNAGPGNAAGLLEHVFDTDGDGIADSHISLPTASGATGLAFSPLDWNPWHVTSARAFDVGHGVNVVPDGTRYDGIDDDADQSFYFGHDIWTPNSFAWEGDMFSNPAIGNTYNFPGGAHGSLIASPFSLAGYAATDRPTLYFNYYLETDGGSADEFTSFMTDSARVFASIDGGRSWELLATNNSDRSELDDFNYQSELPPVPSVSSGISGAGYEWNGVRVPNQHVQELFDNTGNWRQARIDLGHLAGENDIRLRFDFSTAGDLPADRAKVIPDTVRVLENAVSSNTVLPLESIDGLQVGMLMRLHNPQYDGPTGTGGGGIFRVESIDPLTKTITVETPVTLARGSQLAFFAEGTNKNNIIGLANEVGLRNGWDLDIRGQDNQHEGLYIDDITVGFVERGEIVANANAGQSGFFDLQTPVSNEYPEQALAGEYQLEIRRGTEYVTQPFQTSDSVLQRNAEPASVVRRQFDTNARFIESTGVRPLVLATNSLTTLDGVVLTAAGNGTIELTAGEVILTGAAPGAGAAGGPGVTIDRFSTPVARTAYAFTYDALSVPDAFLIEGGGQVFVDTGDVSGIDTITFWKPEGVEELTITVTGPEGTIWSYELNPPNTTQNLLAWNLDLDGVSEASLSFKNFAGSDENLEPLPETFTTTTGLPNGDGVAISTDGGTNWRRLATFTGGGDQWVNLLGRQETALTATTVIGFFQSNSAAVDAGIRLSDFLVAIEPIIATTGTIGDANNAHEYEQGQFVIESNLITAAAQYGVRIDAGRDEGSDPDGNYVGVTNEPDLGVARNVPVQNNPRLVPGAVVNNNVITGAGAAGILFSGTTSTQAQPQSVVPYGRIINNTIFGGEGSTATGVDVNENAGPTLINNVFAELGVGVRVDTSSREDAAGDRRTVITTSAFHAVGVEVAGAEHELGLTLTKSPFVNAAGGNFYPTTGTAIVDSSLSSLQERNEYRVVTEAIGVAASPIIAPVRDIYGQLRVDDPQQATDEPGLGGSVFHDRGAVERADQSRPFARIVSPLDQGERPVDTDESLDSVVIEGAEARGVRTFAIQLNDVGVGIDKATVTSDAFVVTRDGVRLLDTIDYRWVYNENTDQVLLQAISVFPIGEYLIAIDSAPADPVTGVAGRVTDRANNPIRRNVTGGAAAATFSIRLLDVPGLPTRGDAAAGDGDAVLSWVEPYSPPSLPILRYDVQQTGDGGQSWSDWLPPSGGVLSVPPVKVPWANNQPLLYRVRAVNAIGVGNWSDPIAARASAVQGVSGAPGKNSVTLNWNPPLNSGGKPIDFYVVERSEDGGGTWKRVPIQASDSSLMVTGLAKNAGQIFRVAAVNAAGVGSWSAATGEIVPQGTADAPTNLTAGIDPADGSVLLEWTGPELTGGVPLTGYQLAYTWVDQAGEDQSGSVPLGVVTSFDLSGLERSTGYTFTVLAKNAHGLSEASTEVSLTTPDVIQTAPSRLTVVAGLGRLELEWQPRTVADEELALVSYVVQVRGTGDTNWTTLATVPADDATSPRYTVVRSRTAGEAEFRVAARNTLAGVDDDDLVYSEATALTLPIARSGPVVNLVGTAGNRATTLNWDASLDLGGGTLLHYKVEFFDGTEWQTFEENLVTEPTVTISGLNNGSEYRFRVTPITSTPLGDTDAGETGVAGAGAETGLVMPFGSATAVTNLTATAEVMQVTLQWNAPINDGGRSLTGYVVEYATSATGPWLAYSDSDPTDLAAAIPEIVTELTQLEKQTEYYFRVAAVNEAGQSEFAAVVSATPIGLPDAPTGLVFTPDQGDGSLLTTWVEPQNTGALPVTYDVQYRKAGTGRWLDLADPDKTDRAADIPSLERGVEYEIQARAVNEVGNSPWLEATFTAPDVPAAPTGLQAIVAQDELGAIELSWAAPAVGAGELAIVDYVIEQSTDGGGSWLRVSDGVSTETTFRVTELDRDDGERVFRVAAKNVLPDVPDSELTYSASSAAVRPLGRSLAVQSLTPSAGDQQAVISWTAPADDGGLPITNYLVEQDDGAGDWSTFGTGPSTELSRTVTGLTNGQSYRFRVTPQTTLGQSTLDGAVSVTGLVMPFGVPSVPTGLVVSGGVGRLTASWTASSPNGRAVSDYVIQWAESANGPWNTYPDRSSAATSVDLVAGTAASDTDEILPAGVPLFVKVRATNEAGDSGFSSAVGPRTILAAPAAPTGLIASVNPDGTIGLAWSAPANDGGSDVTDYLIGYRLTGETSWTPCDDGESPNLTATVSDLPRDAGFYEFRVAAVNAIGQGAASLPSNAVRPLATAGPVAELAVTPGSERLTVTWTPPSDNGGAAVTDYEIEYKTAASANWIRLSEGTNAALSVTIPNLTNGTNYAVRVRAVNSVGQGAWAELGPVMPVTGPGAPASLVVSVDSGRASLGWTAPAGGGVPVNDYILQYRLASESTWITWNDAVSANPAATITGLTNGLTYVFRVKATTMAFPHDPTNPGFGDWAVSESRVIGPKAAAPLVAAAQKYGNGILLTWNRITPPAGFSVLSYQVEYYSAADGEWQVAGQADPRANSLLVDGARLERGTYTLRVAAITTVGVGNYRVSNAVTY